MKEEKQEKSQEAVEPKEMSWREKRRLERKGRGGILAGLILVILGAGFLLQNIFPWFSFNYVWPSILVVIGLYLVVRGLK